MARIEGKCGADCCCAHDHDHDHDHEHDHGHGCGHEHGLEIAAAVEGMSLMANSLVFDLKGLDCADCAKKLEIKLGKLSGLTQAKVNFGAAKLYVQGELPAQKVINAVREAGYEALLPGQQESREENKSFWLQDKKARLTLASGLFWALGLLLWTAGLESAAVPVLLCSIVVGAVFTVRTAFYSLKSGFAMDMNVLMTIAVLGALYLGEWMEAATVVFLFSLGNSLEAFTMDKTRKSIRGLMELAPNEALVRRNGSEMPIPVEELVIGDEVIIKPGARIPIDGRVLEGRSSVNEAPITGESVPAAKGCGDEVFAGTINGNGLLVVEVTRLAADTTLARIIAMVEEAQAQKAPAERFVDVFAKYYTPTVIVLAALIAVVPPFMFSGDWATWFYRAITLLVVACPCALVISTPVAIVAAIGNAAKKGVLIKGGAHLEQAGKIKAIAFDKTGTLTWGRPVVSNIVPVPGYSKEEVLAKAAAVEAGSEHPLAGAILKEINQRGMQVPPAKDFSALTGRGAKALVDQEVYYVGSPVFFTEDLGLPLGQLVDQVHRLEEQGKTVIVVGREKEILGAIACGDTLRETSRQAVAALKQQGIKRVMLTGDNPRTAKSLARELELNSFRAGLLPEDKVDAIKELVEDYGPVAMVGDGINDAPALAAANVGIAMGGAGTDTALETADIALMADDLSKLPFTVRLSQKALSIIRQNIAFALIVKLAAVTMVFPGILNLWIAILADTGAALIVIANGMRLLKVK